MFGLVDMMAQNGDAVSTGDSFWDVNGYQRVVKRTDSGAQMCGELSKLVLERSEIEKEYAKRLKSWAHKWRDNFDHGLVFCLCLEIFLVVIETDRT